jgi:hypothetical protein
MKIILLMVLPLGLGFTGCAKPARHSPLVICLTYT